MPEKRPKWSRLTQAEIKRQQANVNAKARKLRSALRQQQRVVAASGAEAASLAQLRHHIGGLEATAASLRFRLSAPRFAAAGSRQPCEVPGTERGQL